MKKYVNNFDEFNKVKELKESFIELEDQEKIDNLTEALDYLAEESLLLNEEYLEKFEDYKEYVIEGKKEVDEEEDCDKDDKEEESKEVKDDKKLDEGAPEANFQVKFQQCLDKYGIKQKHDIDNPDVRAKFYAQFKAMSGIELNETIVENMFEDNSFLDGKYKSFLEESK